MLNRKGWFYDGLCAGLHRQRGTLGSHSGEQAGAKISSDSFGLLFGCQLSDSLILGIILCYWECEVTLHQGTAHADLEIKGKAQGHEDGEVSKWCCFCFRGFFSLQDNHRFTCHWTTLTTAYFADLAWSHSDVQNHHCGHLNTGRQRYSWAFNPSAAVLDCFISQL